MRKWVIFAVLLAVLGVTACDDEESTVSPQKVEDPKAYGTLCVNSGGEFKEGSCICHGIACDAGDLCNSETKDCPIHVDPDQFKTACAESGGTPNGSVCTCSGEPCAAWQLCVDNKCPKPPKPDFSQLCSYSGGEATGSVCTCAGNDCEAGVICSTETGMCPVSSSQCIDPTGSEFEKACQASGGAPAGGICVCNSVGCGRGVICNFNTKNCADQGIQNGDPCTGNGSECYNNDELNGQLIACNGSTYEISECSDTSGNPLSCHNNKCGSCKNYTNQCINQLNDKGEEIGVVQECQEGVPGKPIAMCNDVSCRADIPSCGECINGKLRCTEDNDNNAIMYRCIEGRWERLRNPLDPFDPGYACPVNCREGTDPQKMEYECDRSQCDKCDPCWGAPMIGAPPNPNPCYDEARCNAIRAAEDKDYPPFRDFELAQKFNDDRAMKQVFGYDFTDHSAVSKPEDRVHNFPLDLTNGTRHVSCKADGSYYGQCHNSLQICINKRYHGEGYIIQCSHGELAEYPPANCTDPEDPNCSMTKGDGIACHCQDTGRNANGCCWSRSQCFKSSKVTSGPELCKKPVVSTDDGYATGNPDYTEDP